jgi:hypothetical protein
MSMRNPQIVCGRGRSSRNILLAVTVTSLCIACADISAVAKFAAVAKKALSQFSGIAEDFSASAQRRAVYVQSLQPQDEAAALAEAARYKDLEPKMLEAQKVVVTYVDGLAALANDDHKARDTSFTPVAADLESAGMSKSEASSGVSVLNKLADAAVSGYRSRELGKVIAEANPPLQDYLKGLEHIVTVNYTSTLADERRSAESYYDGLVHQYGGQEPLAAVLIQVQEKQDLAKIDARAKAAEDYGKVLVNIGEAHQKLADNDHALDSQTVKSMLEEYAGKIEADGEKAAKAF